MGNMCPKTILHQNQSILKSITSINSGKTILLFTYRIIASILLVIEICNYVDNHILALMVAHEPTSFKQCNIEMLCNISMW